MKKSAITVIAASCGAVMFAGAAVANYTTADGYEIVKNSILGFRGMTSYTIDFSIGLWDEDGNGAEPYNYYEYDQESNRSYTAVGTKLSFGGESREEKSQFWEDGTSYVYQYSNSEMRGQKKTPGEISTVVGNPMTEDLFGDKNSTEKVINFMSAALDTVAGDLKNNFIYMGTDDGLKSYKLSLDAIQIPEVVNAGLSALTSVVQAENEGYIPEDEEEKLAYSLFGLEDTYTKSVTGDFKINEDNTFNMGEIKAVITGVDEYGEAKDYTVAFKLTLSNVGSTVPQEVPSNFKQDF